MNKMPWLVTIGLFVLALATSYFWWQKSYLLMTMALMLIAFIPFFARFEGRRVRAEEIVLLAELTAIAAVVRIPFAAIPSVQPTSFVVMIAGLTFGCERGFLVGALAALVSNIFLGQGPWTPWQMFARGMMGFSAGAFRQSRLLAGKYGRIIFGFSWGLAFGWFMNLWYMVNLGENLSWQLYLLACAASFPMDLAHGTGNAFFLLIFDRRFLSIMERIKIKYRL